MGCQVITEEAAQPAINAPLLRQTLAHIEANPQTWHQGHWRCKTGMCFAGWTAQLAGGRWAGSPDSLFGSYLVAEDGDLPGHVQETAVGAVVDVSDRATRLLGISVGQSITLFRGSNDLPAIRRIVADLIGQVPHVTIRVVPADELVIGEEIDGRAPLEVIEHRPGLEPMLHGTERGIPLGKLTDHARSVAETLGVPFIDPIDPAVTERLMAAEVAW